MCAGFAVFLIWARKTTKEFDQIPEQSTEAIIIAKMKLQLEKKPVPAEEEMDPITHTHIKLITKLLLKIRFMCSGVLMYH